MDSRKGDSSDFFKPRQQDAAVTAAKEYFKNCIGRVELNKLFPDKEITYIQIHYIPHHEYRKGDVISNIDGMTMMTLEFSDGTKEPVKWKDDKIDKSKVLDQKKPKSEPEETDKKWQYGDELDPSPLVANSFLNKGAQTIVKFPIVQFDTPKSKGPNQ